MSGVVTGLADFGAFVALGVGVEGLVHISELGDPPPEKPEVVVQPGDELVLRILRIDSSRRRIGLSLKRVTKEERDEWLHRADADQAEDAVSVSEPLAEDVEISTVAVDKAEEMMSNVPEHA